MSYPPRAGQHMALRTKTGKNIKFSSSQDRDFRWDLDYESAADSIAKLAETDLVGAREALHYATLVLLPPKHTRTIADIVERRPEDYNLQSAGNHPDLPLQDWEIVHYAWKAFAARNDDELRLWFALVDKQDPKAMTSVRRYLWEEKHAYRLGIMSTKNPHKFAEDLLKISSSRDPSWNDSIEQHRVWSFAPQSNQNEIEQEKQRSVNRIRHLSDRWAWALTSYKKDPQQHRNNPEIYQRAQWLISQPPPPSSTGQGSATATQSVGSAAGPSGAPSTQISAGPSGALSAGPSGTASNDPRISTTIPRGGATASTSGRGQGISTIAPAVKE
ncbi:MAG: hypothetical protein M1820_008358 [Bogoriella megaspora]|nr:MAG: hypothetical protein M1820_008358 [Bogoriella megaspora]